MGNSLGDLEQLVLLAVLRLDGDAYGVSIRDEIDRRTGRKVALGSVYKALDRLAAKTMVTGEMGDPTPVRGGRRRRFYQIEPAGERALEQSLAEIRSMLKGLEPRWRSG